jgi:hypothetical protein
MMKSPHLATLNKAPSNPPKGNRPTRSVTGAMLYVLFALFGLGHVASAQSSYETMEKRFVKKQLTAEDSAAFKTQGVQKAQSLFYQTDLYMRNSGNTSNQVYIANRMPDLFYVADGDTLDLQPLRDAISKIQRSKKYTQPKFKTSEADGYLAKLETTNTKPKLEFFLVLMKAPKRFGDEEELVWQVFLAEPVIK